MIKPATSSSDTSTVFVNFVIKTELSELCDKCAEKPFAQARLAINAQIDAQFKVIEERIVDFPMFTGYYLSASADVKLKNMITRNHHGRDEFFSEFSQGFSDFFGAVNVASGMSHKVNKGEAAARSILVDKAMVMNANCIISVDIDYGVTGNNAATINMQGTAASIANLDAVLDAEEFAKAQELHEAVARYAQLKR